MEQVALVDHAANAQYANRNNLLTRDSTRFSNSRAHSCHAMQCMHTLRRAGRRKKEGLAWSLHSRHRYDPPEVVTVASLDGGGRWGYHRDSPDEPPTCVVASVADTKHKRGRFAIIAPTLQDAIVAHCKTRLKGLTKSAAETILARASSAAAAAASASPSSGAGSRGQKRGKRVPVDTTLSGLGIVVPYDKKTEVGWRELSVSDTNLEK
jgi:hypothetical protein